MFGADNNEGRNYTCQELLISSVRMFQWQIQATHLLVMGLPLALFFGGLAMAIIALVRGEAANLNYLRFTGGIALSTVAPFVQKRFKPYIDGLYKQLAAYHEMHGRIETQSIGFSMVTEDMVSTLKESPEDNESDIEPKHPRRRGDQR